MSIAISECLYFVVVYIGSCICPSSDQYFHYVKLALYQVLYLHVNCLEGMSMPSLHAECIS